MWGRLGGVLWWASEVHSPHLNPDSAPSPQPPQHPRQILQISGNQVAHLPLPLLLAVYRQQA